MEMIYDHNNAELTKTDILLASIFMLIFELCKEKMGFDVIASIVTGSLWFLNIGVMLVCMRILKTTSLKY